MTLHFNSFREMYKFTRGNKVFVEPERVGEVKDEVSPKRPNKRKSKADAGKVGKSAKDKN